MAERVARAATRRGVRRRAGPSAAVTRRLGLFGGTFDPPHVGHLILAECARDALRLDGVVFMPAAQPPHKAERRLSPVAARVAMTRLAVRGHPAFSVSTLETRRRGPSYTVDTLRALRRARPRTEWVLVIGEDSLRELRTWREPEAIRALAELAVARRAPETVTRPAHPNGASPRAGIRWVSMPRVDVSSRELRRRVRDGESVRYLVPDAVERYIRRHGLYRSRAGRGGP